MDTNQSVRKLSARTLVFLMVLLFTNGIRGSKPDERPTLSKADFDAMMHSLSNWGRWGQEDQFGALNLITAEKRRQAASLVREGLSISLSHDVIKVKLFDSQPFEHKMTATGQVPGKDGSGDRYSVEYHGFTQTHLDALCHQFYNGRMYDGFSEKEVTDVGARKLSVINMKNGILTRGVLVDLPYVFGVRYFKGRRAIYPEDLDAFETKTGVRIEAGDAVLINTGHWVRYQAEGEWDVMKGSAGLDASCMRWLKKRDVAVLGSDLVSDVVPSGVEGVRFPVHMLSIIALGVPIVDNCDFQAVSAAAVKRKRWTFLLTINPLAVDGGTGSPVNPVATF
jgi:kynurenine formamidase